MPGGQFNPNNLPTQPGFYVNFQAAATAAITGGDNGIVLVPFTSDWGPVGVFQTVRSQAEFEALYGPNNVGTGRYAVLAALTGNGDTRQGASQVLCYRMADSSMAKATKQLSNTTPATMLTLTAKYEGTRPANWTVTVQTNAVDATKKDIILYENGVELERFSSILQTDATAMAAAINATDGTGSSYMTAVAGTTGVALANISSSAFNSSAGNSGLSPIGSDWTNMQTLAQNQMFHVMAPANLTDGTIRAALVAWATTRNQVNQRFMLVVGSAAGETAATANTRSQGFNNENVVSLGYTDLYDSDGVTTISTAQFAPRVAGAIADAGVTRSVTNLRFKGVTLKVVPSETDLANAYTAGTLVFTTDSHGVKINQGITSYQSQSATKPRAEFGVIKSVRTHQQIERDLSAAAADDWIGGDSINVAPVVSGILGAIAGYLRTLEDSQVILHGWTVGLDPAKNNSGNTIFVLYGISTAKAIERIFNTLVLK